MLVQALVAQATIERFYKAVLLRFSGCDVMPLDPGVLAPGEDRMTGQLGASLRIDPPDQPATVGVADHHARQPTTFGDRGQLAHDAPTLQRGVDDRRQTFAAVIVDHVQQAEPPAAGQRIRHKVERPSLVRLLRDRHRCPRPQRALPAPTLAHRQFHRAIDSPDCLLIRLNPRDKVDRPSSGSCPCPHARAGSPAADMPRQRNNPTGGIIETRD